LLAYCRKRKDTIDAVLVYALTRFSRNSTDHYAIGAHLRGLGIGLRSVTEPIDDSPADRLMEGILAAMSQFDNEQRAERTQTGLASARVRRFGLQYRSSASQTGRQYCAVDSITTSSTSCSTSQSASNWTGLVPTFSRSKWKSPATSTSATDGQHLLVHVNPREVVRHRPLLVGAESVPRRITQGRELSPDKNNSDAQLFGESRTLRVKPLLRSHLRHS
jgi:hypothetical protein